MTNQSPTDWRGLCEELAHEVEQYAEDRGDLMPECADRARAALAQPEPEVGPTDEELDALVNEHCWDPNEWIDYRSYARAVLARYGHQPAPPAEGEVAELVAWLRMQGEAQKPGPNSLLSDQTKKERHAIGVKLTRAADLLEQRHPAPVPVSERKPGASHFYFEFVISDADDCTQAGGIAPTYAQALSEGQHYLAQYQQDGPHTLELRRVEVSHPDALPEQRQAAPVPVAVSERLPGTEDCDEEGRCWWLKERANPDHDLLMPTWHLQRQGPAGTRFFRFTHWLPANALPLPQGEVE